VTLATADDRRVPPAERGIAEMMIDLLRGFVVAQNNTCCVWIFSPWPQKILKCERNTGTPDGEIDPDVPETFARFQPHGKPLVTPSPYH